MIVTPLEWYGMAALLVCCLPAIWRGTPGDRRAALVIAVAWVACVLVDDDASRGVQWGIFAIDIALAAWLLVEGVFGKRLWLAAAAAAQTFIVATHVAFMIDADIQQEGFFSTYYLWSFVVLICLALGPLLSPRRRPQSTATISTT